MQKTRGQPRTAARRSHVRASVRAGLARELAGAPGVQALAARRARAGIPALRLFGDAHQLDYFSEDDEGGASESASTAVAARPTSNILSTYRQVNVAAALLLFYFDSVYYLV